MKNFIIGIAGNKNSGKDTVASIINYIFAKGITKARYADYLTNQVSYDNKYSDRIIHFADPLKDVLSIIYNIPRELLDSRIHKDGMWYNIRANTFSMHNNANADDAIFIDIVSLQGDYDIQYYLTMYPNKQVYIKLRTLIQYFGTNICREHLADDIWIKSTMAKAVDIVNGRRLCIIPDVRFANEAKAIRNDDGFLYGGVIKINRDICDTDSHSSEIIDFPVDFEINNNGTLLNLFYNVLDICQTII